MAMQEIAAIAAAMPATSSANGAIMPKATIAARRMVSRAAIIGRRTVAINAAATQKNPNCDSKPMTTGVLQSSVASKLIILIIGRPVSIDTA